MRTPAPAGPANLEPAAAHAADALPFISFVIPVRNDAARLRQCLAGVAYPRERVEIIVADNGSQDGSAEAACGAVVLSLAGLTVSSLRNRGASEARGEILAFIDADHAQFPGFNMRDDLARRSGWAIEQIPSPAVADANRAARPVASPGGPGGPATGPGAIRPSSRPTR